MANLPTTYATGTVTVGAGSTTVTGSGTSFVAAGVEAGDIFWASGLSVRIAAVNSATSLTLAYPWPGGALSAANYEVRYTPDITRALASARDVLTQLTNGNLSSVAALATAANKLAYYTGQGTAALADLTPEARTLLASSLFSRSGSDYTLNAMLKGSAVAQNPLDSTAGRLTRTGDGGVLGAAPLWTGSADDIPLGVVVASGQITEQQAIDNKWPAVPGASTATLRWFVLQCLGSSSRTVQIATEVFGIGSAKCRTYRRTKQDSTWSAWSLVYDQASAVGTVSFSGGVPAGALIEIGSNANGRYLRFTDGTQICYHLGSSSDAGAVSWTFPAAFVSTLTPVVLVSASAINTPHFCVVGGQNYLAAQFSVFSMAGARVSLGAQLMAIGRWV